MSGEGRQSKEPTEHPGLNDEIDNSTDHPERRKKPLDVHGIGPTNAKNARRANFFPGS